MPMGITIWSLGFLGCFYGALRFFVEGLLEHSRIKIQELEIQDQTILNEQQKISEEKASSEKEAAEIFLLYEMTKEIARKLNEQDALAVFGERLKQFASFEECRFISEQWHELEAFRHKKDHYIFPLRNKMELMGYLVIKGLKTAENNKVMILCHQFSLALRRVQLYQRVERLAVTDGLTGVHTRRFFLERFSEELNRSIAQKNELSVLMIDIDYFKNINDAHGHLIGDQILRNVGGIIKDNLREIDVIGRYGGEEFCVLLPVTDQKGALYAAERIRAAVAEAVIHAYDVSVRTTISMGVARFPVDGRDVSVLLDKSDWALYRAKKKGRNCVCVFGVYDKAEDSNA